MALTQITEKGIKDGEILNADINANAAIAGTKISPDFGSQNIVTTGSISGAAGTFTGDLTIPDKIVHTGDTDTAIRLGVDTITAETAGSERIRINSSGDVGIGTTSPAQIFHVKNTGAHTTWRIENDNADFLIQAGDAGADGLHFYDFDNSAYRMTIANSGRVGIGTSSPQQPLHLHTASSSAANMVFSNTTTGSGASDGFVVGLDGAERGQIFNQENTDLLFGTNNLERLRIDSSGNVMIGATSASGKLHVEDSGELNSYFVGNTSTSGSRIILQNKNTTANSYTGLLGADAGGQTTSQILFYNADNANNEGYMTFETRPSGGLPTERMRIDSAGGLRLGTTSSNYDELFTIVESGTDNEIATWRVNDGGHTKDMLNMIHVANSGNRVMIRFRRTGSLTSVGDIVTSASSTSYVTSSDYRLKENVTSITDGITRLKTLKPYRFNFKIEPDKTVDGFLAHEASEVVPEAVVGEKDAVDAEGNIDAQAIDQSKLVPLLTAALQEAVAKIETLETKVAALEAA